MVLEQRRLGRQNRFLCFSLARRVCPPFAYEHRKPMRLLRGQRSEACVLQGVRSSAHPRQVHWVCVAILGNRIAIVSYRNVAPASMNVLSPSLFLRLKYLVGACELEILRCRNRPLPTLSSHKAPSRKAKLPRTIVCSTFPLNSHAIIDGKTGIGLHFCAVSDPGSVQINASEIGVLTNLDHDFGVAPYDVCGVLAKHTSDEPKRHPTLVVTLAEQDRQEGFQTWKARRCLPNAPPFWLSRPYAHGLWRRCRSSRPREQPTKLRCQPPCE